MTQTDRRQEIGAYVLENPGCSLWRAAMSVTGRHADVADVVREMIANGELRAEETTRGTSLYHTGIERDHIPSDVDLEELIQRRRSEYQRTAAHHDARRLQRVRVHLEGPIGILHFGDPHLDDPGTDLGLLLSHAELVRRTPGMFAGNVGDSANNWVGKLAHLHGQQTTTAREAWVLAEHWVRLTRDWLYLVGGNHDAWSGAGDPMAYIGRMVGCHQQPAFARLLLELPGGHEFTLHVRHDFPGRSQWNPTHGQTKEAKFGYADDVIISGHRHISGYAKVYDEPSGRVSHCIQVASYKRHDRYAVDMRYRDHSWSPCCVTVLDPRATGGDRVHVWDDPELGAEYLTWLRSSK